jgi:hypothetical protein
MEIKSFLSKNPEATPTWLKDFKVGDKPKAENLLHSRIIYFPGGRLRAQPVSTIMKAKHAHVFIYATYGTTKRQVDTMFKKNEVEGFQCISIIDYETKEFFNENKTLAIHLEEGQKRTINYEIKEPFVLVGIFEEIKSPNNGIERNRFAVVFFNFDGISLYNLMFNTSKPKPHMLILNHGGFNRNYDRFVRGSLIEKIAFKTSVFPQLLFSLHDKETWRGFKKIHNLQPLAFRDPPLQDNYSLYEYDSAYFEIPNEDKPKRLNSVFYCFETEISSEKFSNNKDVEHIVFMAGPVITSIDYNAFSELPYLKKVFFVGSQDDFVNVKVLNQIELIAPLFKFYHRNDVFLYTTQDKETLNLSDHPVELP